MIDIFSTPVPFHLICFNRFLPSKIRQISDHGEEPVVRNVEGDKANLAWLLLPILPLSNLPLLAYDLRAPGRVIPSRSIGDHDLLSGCADVVLKHGVFVHSVEQIVYCCWRFFGKRFKKRRTWANTYFENLIDGVHATRFHLEHDIFEPLHKLPQQLILLHIYVL